MLPRRAEILHRFFIVIYYSIDTSCAPAASFSPAVAAERKRMKDACLIFAAVFRDGSIYLFTFHAGSAKWLHILVNGPWSGMMI
jgi:hypothetical protein